MLQVTSKIIEIKRSSNSARTASFGHVAARGVRGPSVRCSGADVPKEEPGLYTLTTTLSVTEDEDLSPGQLGIEQVEL